jgi:hypothetical protein
MKPLAVAAWSIITPFGEDDATVDALFEQRSAFSPQASHLKLRNALAAVVPERPSHAARDGQWQRYLATYVTRKVLDTLSMDIQAKDIVAPLCLPRAMVTSSMMQAVIRCQPGARIVFEACGAILIQ